MTEWHSTPRARQLLDAAAHEQPKVLHIRRNEWDACVYPKFRSPSCDAFRQLWEDERMAALEANDRPQYVKLGELLPDDILAELFEGLTETVGDPFLRRNAA